MSDKSQFIEQNKTTPTDLNICRGFNFLMRTALLGAFLRFIRGIMKINRKGDNALTREISEQAQGVGPRR